MDKENPINDLPTDAFWKLVAADAKVRREVTRGSFPIFYELHFQRKHHLPLAACHKEIMGALEDMRHRFVLLEAFRGAGKTMIANQAYVLWSIVGIQQKRNVLIFAQTQEQVRYYLANIKRKMKEDLVRKDLGPFFEGSGDWRWNTIEIPKYGARITVASIDQSVRGVLHDDRRPDLIVADDLENTISVRSFEMRDKLYNVFTRDVLPLGDNVLTRTIVIGTRLHEDGLLLRLRREIEEKKRDGLILSYPLLDKDGKPAWPAKYPDMHAIEAERKRIGNEIAFRQEYLLELVPEGSQIIPRDWIHYYDELPLIDSHHSLTITAVDPAFGQKESNDYTAIVSVEVFVFNWELYVYVLPNPVNERMRYPDMLDRVAMISKSLGRGWPTTLVYEDVGAQKAGIQDLEQRGFYVIPFRPGTTDKQTRLAMTSPHIKSANILFPKKGAEELINQIVYFPHAKHDDLMDSFCMAILQAMSQVNAQKPDVIRLF